MTLPAGAPAEVPIYLGHAVSRSQLRSVAKLDWEVEKSTAVMGVNGLEPSHEYEVSVNEDDVRRVMWTTVAKESIPLEGGHKRSKGDPES
ncbi:hypothetical protein PG994_009070 [Apiospora phragmitis]|uniref:Uncharacterized protein n=1 Tax=Apiospora phragmitis TaxID=2905665 RepID=A0ABR1UI96_9PEZI